MAKTNPRQLFVTAFKNFNLTRYANSRVDKPRFQGLGMSELAFGELTVDEETRIGTFATIESESRRFTALNQSFTQATLNDAGIATVQSVNYPYEDVITMKALSQPGLTAYMNEDLTKVLVAVVFSEANTGTLEDVQMETQSIITLACNFEIDPTEIVVTTTEDPKVWKVVVNNEIIHADIIAVRSELPVLDIPVTDYGLLATEIVVPNPYPPVNPE